MNKLLTIFILIILTTIINGAQAQGLSLGYSSHLVFSNGTTSNVAGETEHQCEENRENLIAFYAMSGVSLDEDRSTPCGPNGFFDRDISSFLDIAVAWNRIPNGPRCLSCPLLTNETFEVFYPNNVAQIKDIYYQYNIVTYNHYMRSIQSLFDLEGFEKEVYQLNKYIENQQQ